jgi:hypothetical protein
MCKNKEVHSHDEEHTHEHAHTHTHPHSDEHGHGLEHQHTGEHEHPHTHSHEHPHGDMTLCHSHGEQDGTGCCGGQDIENKDIEILTLLLDHWVAHNQDHAMEYNTWVEKMNRLGKNDVAEKLIEAIALMSEADKHLIEAKKAFK